MFTGLEIGFTSLIYPESEGLDPTATGYHDLKTFDYLLTTISHSVKYL